MVKLNLASFAIHLCLMASSLVVVSTYVNGLLSEYDVKVLPYKYSWKLSVMAHFKAKNSSLWAR